MLVGGSCQLADADMVQFEQLVRERTATLAQRDSFAKLNKRGRSRPR